MSAGGLPDTLRGAFVLLRVGAAPVVLFRGNAVEDADKIQLSFGDKVCVKRCYWCARGEWSAPSPFEGFSLDEVLATDWRIV